MRKQWFQFLLLFTIGASCIQAEESEGIDAYEDCILHYLPAVEESAATGMITYACYRLYQDNFMLEEEDQAYFQCLLDHLPDSKKTQVSLTIKQTCHEKHRSLFQ